LELCLFPIGIPDGGGGGGNEKKLHNAKEENNSFEYGSSHVAIIYPCCTPLTLD